MKHSIKITQTLEGHVDIEADSLQAALQKAEDLYEKNGHELPDMDDGARLKFSAEGPKRTPDRANNVKLWLRVGMTLEVTPEMKKQLEAGSIDGIFWRGMPVMHTLTGRLISPILSKMPDWKTWNLPFLTAIFR